MSDTWMGDARFRTLCRVTDLLDTVTDLHREFVTSGGELPSEETVQDVVRRARQLRPKSTDSEDQQAR